MKKAVRDAAGHWIRVGDTVGGTTWKMNTIVGETVQIGASKVKVRLEKDSVPAGRGPEADDEVWISTERVFLAERASRSRQALFTGEVDEKLTSISPQEAAWLLFRAVYTCMCTDPDPGPCTEKCVPAPKGCQCPCHYVHATRETRQLLADALKLTDKSAPDPKEIIRHLSDVYGEAGHRDLNAQRYARELLAEHTRLLEAILTQVAPFVTDDAGHSFGAGFAGAAAYLRAYAYGLDPEGAATR